jgi:hypothetical protein
MHASKLVAVRERNLVGSVVAPAEHDSLLTAHADAMQAPPLPGKRLETVGRRYAEVLKARGGVELLPW